MEEMKVARDGPEDDVQLAEMGHKPELQRNFSTLCVLPNPR
jgi:choline transport protein